LPASRQPDHEAFRRHLRPHRRLGRRAASMTKRQYLGTVVLSLFVVLHVFVSGGKCGICQLAVLNLIKSVSSHAV